jgi:hypothetical protein
LEEYHKFFSKDRIFIAPSEDLEEKRFKTMRKIFRFLHVDDTYVSQRFRFRLHQSRRKVMRSAAGARLEKAPVMKLLGKLPYEIQGPVERLILRPFSRTVEKPKLGHDLKRMLQDRLKGDADRMREYTGRRLTNWSV